MNANFSDYFTDPGFLIILLLPIFFLITSNQFSKRQKLLVNGVMMLLSSLLLIFSISGAYMNKNYQSTPQEALAHLYETPTNGSLESINQSITSVALKLYEPFFVVVNNISGEVDSFTYPLLITLFVCLLLLFRYRVVNQPIGVQATLVFSTMYFLLWWIIGAGMNWYGMLLFCLPFFFIFGKLSQNKNNSLLSNWRKPYVLTLAAIWILCAFVFRASSYNPSDGGHAKSLFIRPVIEYQTGTKSRLAAINESYPNSKKFIDILNEDKKGKIYRIGTLFKYFIENNDERVYDDTFLNLFDQMLNRIQDPDKIITALKINGFKYILVDLNLPAADFTPEKSLTTKFQTSMKAVVSSSLVELAHTDRVVEINGTGERINAVVPYNGKIVELGRRAIYRIK